MLRDETLHQILFSLFDIPVELRNIISEHYFPYLPNEAIRLNIREMKFFHANRARFDAYYRVCNIIQSDKYVFCLLKNNDHTAWMLECISSKGFDQTLFYYPVALLKKTVVLIEDLVNLDELTEEEIKKYCELVVSRYRKSVLTFIDANLEELMPALS